MKIWPGQRHGFGSIAKWPQPQGSDTILFDKGYYLRGPKPLACALWILANERRAENVMSKEENVRSILTSADVSQLPLRGCVGLVIEARDVATAINRIREAEQVGVQQAWMTQSVGMVDTLTLFAAAATQTKRIRLGTSIVPIYPRHPLVMAQQAATIEALAPGRLRLGVGTSHRDVVENVYGLPMPSPLAYLREYVEVMRQGLWDGRVDHQGRFFKVAISFPRQAQIPLLISAVLATLNICSEKSEIGAKNITKEPSSRTSSMSYIPKKERFDLFITLLLCCFFGE